jgi:hypothetical protein
MRIHLDSFHLAAMNEKCKVTTPSCGLDPSLACFPLFQAQTLPVHLLKNNLPFVFNCIIRFNPFQKI